MRLENKVAIITGASSGIGRETGKLFAAEGANVVLVDIDDAGGQETLSMSEAAGGTGIYVHADQSQAAEVAAMIEKAEETYGRVDVLFNNAGISHAADDDALNTTEEVWDITFDVNVKGVFLCCKYGIPALRRAGGGSIINTASFVAHLGAATPQLAYTASKGAVLSMTRELATIHFFIST